MIRTLFGARLAYLRKQKKMTQDDVASYLGITRPAYTAYESNRREPDYLTLDKLADLFGVTVDYLLGRTDDLTLSAVRTIDEALADDPDLFFFFQDLKNRDDLQLLFKQVRPLSPAGVKKIIRVIKAIEDEEDGEG